MRSFWGIALIACACGTVSSNSDAPEGADAMVDGAGQADAAPDAAVDECSLGLGNCDVNADCIDEPGSPGFRCACREGYSGDGVTCADIDECTTGFCDAAARCVNSIGSYSCTCPAVTVDTNRNGTLCSPAGDGHVVMIGHDFFEHNAAMDTLVGNSVLLANTTGIVNVIAYSQFIDVAAGAEAEQTDLAIATRLGALGRTSATTRFTDPAALEDMLFDAHVLLVYEQETTDIPTLQAVGDAWGPALQAFVARGGVVVVTGGQHDYVILHRAGLMDVSTRLTYSSGTALTIADPADPIVAGMDASYTGMSATSTYTSLENGVVARDATNNPAVLHRVVAGGHAVLIGHDFFERSASIDMLVGNAVALAHTSGDIRILGYTQYADTSLSGEIVLTNAAITDRLAALGRTATITAFADQTQLGVVLPGKHVLLVYEQENTDGGTLATVGTAWNGRLQRFVRAGGVVVVLDDGSIGNGSAWNILNSGGLMSITSSTDVLAGATVDVLVPGDPVVAGLSATYPASEGSAGYVFAGGELVLAAAASVPVVARRIFTPF
jgi:hypothetical protein